VSDESWGDSWSTPRAYRSTAVPDLSREPVYEQLPERGLPGWAALLLLVVIAGIGGLIDAITGAQVRGGFNWGIVIASVVAILAVRRSNMFPVVVAPPIVYSAGSGAKLYIRSSGLHDKKVFFDAAANWLVYGFPAIAGATAAVLIVAGIRLIAHR
jgi:fumarate reductase subunit D